MLVFKDFQMHDANGIGVYVGTYKKYNEGSLYGMWIDLEAVSDAEEFFKVCRALHSDEADPEFMFQDFQGFPDELYHESMNTEDIERILKYVALDDDERKMLEDYYECYGGNFEDDELDRAKERCVGCYDSFQDYADQCADEELACMNAPEFCTRYFDYEAYARDLKYDYSVGSHGYIFNDNY